MFKSIVSKITNHEQPHFHMIYLYSGGNDIKFCPQDVLSGPKYDAYF